MKKTQRIVLMKNIWATRVSFFSITLFVALGIAIFLGIKWNQPAFHYSADKYFEDYGFHDFAVKYPFGFTYEDVAALEKQDEVSLLEGGYTADGVMRLGEDNYVLSILSLTEKMDLADAIEGVLPAAANEVGIEQMMAQDLGLSVGDTIRVKSARGGKNSLARDDFKITAIVAHPAYINLQVAFSRGMTSIGDGELDYYVLMSEDAFNKDAYDNCFSALYVRCDSLRGLNSFSGEYKSKAAAVASKLQKLGDERGSNRYETIKLRYETELDDAEQKIADGEKELAEAEQKISDAERELADAEAQIIDGEAAISAGRKELAEGEEKYADGVKAYNEGVEKLAAGKPKIISALQTLNGKIQDGFDYIDSHLTDDQKQVLADLFAMFGIDRSMAAFSTDPATARGQLAAVLNAMKRLERYLVDEQNDLDTLKQDIADYNLMADGTPEKDAAKAALENALDQKSIPHIDPDFSDSVFEIDKSLAIAARIQAGLTSVPPGLSDTPIALLSSLVSGIDSYLVGEAALRDAWIQLVTAFAKIEDGRRELEENEKKLQNAKLELESGRQEIEDGKKELESNRIKLADGKIELEQARADFDGILGFDRWTVEKRVDNVSYGITDSYSSSGQKLCYSMSMLFVFVGVMICYTAVSRTVRERRIQTGVQKALGFTRKEIITQYMAYSIIAVLLGAALGAALGYFVIEAIMNRSFEPSYVVGVFKKHFSVTDWLLISGAELVLICFATWLACHNQLSRKAVDLISGNDQLLRRTRFYEKQRWWKRSSLYTQTTINNLVNDRTRVIATLVGVSGCTALIIMALSFQASVINTPEMHYSDVSLYDRRLVSDDSAADAMSSLRRVLDEENVNYAEVRQKLFFIEDSQGALDKTDLIVPLEPERFGEYIRFNDPTSGKRLAFTSQGVFVSHTYSIYHGAEVGGVLKLLGLDGQYHSFTVAGIIEHYLPTNQVFMSPECYERVMGEKAVGNTFYINLNGADPDVLKDKLSGVDGYFAISDDHVKWTTVFAAYQKTTIKMVAISFFLSAVMALMVLLNLNVVVINERVKELIVMRINGFSVSAVKKYVYRDNIVLTALGALLGVGAGILLAVYVISSLSLEGANLSTKPNFTACLAGVGITAVFTLITNLIALRRIDKLRVSDLNKQ